MSTPTPSGTTEAPHGAEGDADGWTGRDGGSFAGCGSPGGGNTNDCGRGSEASLPGSVGATNGSVGGSEASLMASGVAGSVGGSEASLTASSVAGSVGGSEASLTGSVGPHSRGFAIVRGSEASLTGSVGPHSKQHYCS